MKMSLGAEPNKVKFLGSLLVVALLVFLYNSLSTGNPGGGCVRIISDICILIHGSAPGRVTGGASKGRFATDGAESFRACRPARFSSIAQAAAWRGPAGPYDG